jgi:hypothetical protein
MIRELYHKNIYSQVNTNGKLLTQERYNWLVGAKLERLVLSTDFFGDKKIKESPYLPIDRLIITKKGRKDKPHTWGGRLRKENRPKVKCNFITDNWVGVYWNGDIVRCCIDWNGEEKLGNVHTYKNEDWTGKEISFCKKCAGFTFHSAFVKGDYDGERKNEEANLRSIRTL